VIVVQYSNDVRQNYVRLRENRIIATRRFNNHSRFNYASSSTRYSRFRYDVINDSKLNDHDAPAQGAQTNGMK